MSLAPRISRNGDRRPRSPAAARQVPRRPASVALLLTVSGRRFPPLRNVVPVESHGQGDPGSGAEAAACLARVFRRFSSPRTGIPADLLRRLCSALKTGSASPGPEHSGNHGFDLYDNRRGSGSGTACHTWTGPAGSRTYGSLEPRRPSSASARLQAIPRHGTYRPTPCRVAKLARTSSRAALALRPTTMSPSGS